MAKKYADLSNCIEAAGVDYKELNYETEIDYQTMVNRLIYAKSRRIDRFCRRPTDFFCGGATITEYHSGKQYPFNDVYPNTSRTTVLGSMHRAYQLDQSPVISVTSIHQNTASIGETAVWEEISNYSSNSNTGMIYFGSNVNLISRSCCYVDNLRFVYVAGYVSVPEEVQWATEELVANAIKKKVEDNLNSRVRFNRPAPIAIDAGKEIFTEEIREMLAPYVKVRM